MSIDSAQKKKLALLFPELLVEVQNDEIDQLSRRLDQQPILLSELVTKIEPRKGEHGEVGERGLDGINGVDGKDGVDGRDGKNGVAGVDGEDGRDGKKGKDGSPDSPQDIAKKLNTLEGAVDISVIRGAITKKDVQDISSGMAKIDGRVKLIDQRWGAHGGGLTKVSHDATLTGNGTPASPLSVVSSPATWYSETPTGAIDGVNTTFTLAHTPVTNSLLLFLNGAFQTNGTDYSLAANVVTFTGPVPPQPTSVMTAQYQ